MSSAPRPRGRPPGSKTTNKRKETAKTAGTASKGKKQKVQDGQAKGLRRANAESKFYTRNILPGFNKRLPPAAQEVVEQALLDPDLADAAADDPRWVELYEQLHRLVDQPSSSASASTSAQPTGENDAEETYDWAHSSPSTSSSSPRTSNQTAPLPPPHQRDTQREAHLTSILPDPALTHAVHRYVSEQLTNQKGALPKHVTPESWAPDALAALGMLVQEIARSQARFNAQRTMFAKSPRNQALAAKRAASKQRKDSNRDDAATG